MKLSVLAIAAALQLSVVCADVHARRHHYLNRRQTSGSSSGSLPPATPPPSTASASPSASPSPSPSAAPARPSTTPGATPAATTPPAPGATPTTPPSGSVPAPSSGTTTTPINTGPPPAATGTDIPPLSQISSGMPTRAALGATTTYAAGVTPPISGAPVLPTPFVFSAAQWPLWDHVPPVDSAEVAAWMKELDGFTIPDLSPTVDGTCLGDPASAAQAAARGWWTCGGYVRDTDIVSCPDKLTWGVSFDDGPAPYTQYLLNYLTQKKILATFFVVGSRVVERPTVLVEEYMAGHEISVHTWSHRPLTSLTNAQVVAELGWTRKAIKTVLGVTPTTMRPPYGDIDDRVRAISLAMGMVPIMWTRTPSGGVFDTNDWRVPAGMVNGTDSFNTFETILNNATVMDTGFIVLQHDLYEASVDLATGYTLPLALGHNPAFTLEPIGKCIKKPTTDMYLESNTNTTFPSVRTVDIGGDGTTVVKSGDGGKTAATKSPASALDVSFAFSASLVAVVGAAFAGLL